MIKDFSFETKTRIKNLLDVDTLSTNDIEMILDNSSAMLEVLARDIKKVPTLRGKTIITLFYESSTRTRVSFEQAGKILSADVINVSTNTSSTKKGESLYDTALTIQAMKADILVIRHPHSGAPHFLARHLKTSIINAGDGTHAHPTQTLLDLFTIKKHLGQIKNKKITIVGDIQYSRVARSNIWGLLKMGASVTLCAPSTLIQKNSFGPGIRSENHPFNIVEIQPDIEKALKEADVVMPLRLQKERQSHGHLPTLREYSRRYGISSSRMSIANPDALVMHPGPMNEGVEIDSDVARGHQSVIEDQVTNGVAVRMSLLHAVSSGSIKTMGSSN
jgi:aspartate carbamoyltransferase catalytic subunit